MDRRSSMELQDRRSFLHRCAWSGDAVHAGVVVTLLIGKSLAIIPLHYPLSYMFTPEATVLSLPSGAATKINAVFAWLAQVERTKQTGLYLLLFVGVDLLKDLRFPCLERIQSGRTRFLILPLVEQEG